MVGGFTPWKSQRANQGLSYFSESKFTSIPLTRMMKEVFPSRRKMMPDRNVGPHQGNNKVL
jgi:hypothetical protein